MTEAPGTHNPQFLPSDIPAPQDDGGARHLTGAKLPDIALPTTDGTAINLSKLKGRTVVYVYPRTGVPGVDPPDGWDEIPARAAARRNPAPSAIISPSSSGLGVAQLFGLSTQDTAYQKEAATRLHLPFAILSDEKLALTRALNLPTFSTSGMTLIKRMALVIDDGTDQQSLLPGFPAGQERRRSDRLASASR